VLGPHDGRGKNPLRKRPRKSFFCYRRLVRGRIKYFCHATKTIPKTAESSAALIAALAPGCVVLASRRTLFSSSRPSHRCRFRWRDRVHGLDEVQRDYRRHSVLSSPAIFAGRAWQVTAAIVLRRTVRQFEAGPFLNVGIEIEIMAGRICLRGAIGLASL